MRTSRGQPPNEAVPSPARRAALHGLSPLPGRPLLACPQVYLDKPLGLRFGRGTKDGAAYILRSDPRLGNTSDQITPGDKIVAVSASFGSGAAGRRIAF